LKYIIRKRHAGCGMTNSFVWTQSFKRRNELEHEEKRTGKEQIYLVLSETAWIWLAHNG